ncbi:mycofactocin system glycosyltransferase [Nocardioides sp. zg-579]|uniref:Mycofactocin system glycosyltransferase n=1 Tax=Nocardioides marmotae TaxID=2663857 RepID=A0A6I3J787_9ACTN|nr:mycofactocin biosynthesis glycosyltransferase MftF [Nocardioides marmotae]MCR6030128.1 mycofactocin system glycosyltransferase [Gordonia jinghuaiqii]MTB93759.1 mycofactocin system glycosyltransferase [Nocardioides marmotae]QKE00097.1 mycofactocin system glycosyltransferase [Nocardioides marmotae]
MTLPQGYAVRLSKDAIGLAGRAVLVGGSPLTAMRLSARAQQLLTHRTVVVGDPPSAQLVERLLATNLAAPVVERLAPVPAAELTVVIPVRDRPAQLGRALAGLTEVRRLVVDDASEDPAAVAEVARRFGATYLPLHHNLGPAGARNVGLRHVLTPYVAFVDSDVETTTGDLLALTRHFADPSVALVGPRVVGRSRSARPRWFETYDEVASSLTLGRTPASVRPGAAVAWLPSACLVGRTAALGAGFDERMRVGEDVDLVWRLIADGHRVRYDPTVQAPHDTRSTLGGWLGRKAFYGTGSGLLGARHGQAVAPAILSPTSAVAGAALLVARPRLLPLGLVGLVWGARSVARVLPDVPGRGPTSARIAARGLGWAVRQESALLVRHWWPAAAVVAPFSRNLRRALGVALLVDTAVMVAEHVEDRARLRPSALLARRLDDLAYGAGLWRGALAARSAQALLPRVPRSPGRSRRNTSAATSARSRPACP